MSTSPPVECFLIIRAPFAEQALRRYVTRGEPCPYGMHNARVVVAELPWMEVDRGLCDDTYPHSDPRWPEKCRCGYVFKDSDEWQHCLEQKYWKKDGTGPLYPLRAAPPGAMWDAYWCDEAWQGTDGVVLAVKLPDGHDFINDGRWVRVGILPKITLHPSIQTSGWHGWLQHGYLVEC